jgi:hypothetical protein
MQAGHITGGCRDCLRPTTCVACLSLESACSMTSMSHSTARCRSLDSLARGPHTLRLRISLRILKAASAPHVELHRSQFIGVPHFSTGFRARCRLANSWDSRLTQVMVYSMRRRASNRIRQNCNLAIVSPSLVQRDNTA